MQARSKYKLSTFSKIPVCRTEVERRPFQVKNFDLQHPEMARRGYCGNSLHTWNGQHNSDVKQSTCAALRRYVKGRAARSRSPRTAPVPVRRATVPVWGAPHGPLTMASDEPPHTSSTSATTNGDFFPAILSDSIGIDNVPSRSGRRGVEGAILGYSPPVGPPTSSEKFATEALRKVTAWRDTAFIKQHTRW